MCCILVARQGLSETELKSILNMSDQMWSVLYFAIEDFILERSGLYGYVIIFRSPVGWLLTKVYILNLRLNQSRNV